MVDDYGNTALHGAETAEQTQLLLSAADNPNSYCLVQDNNGNIALHCDETAEQK